MPTKEEEKMLLSFNGDQAMLGNAEKVCARAVVVVVVVILVSCFSRLQRHQTVRVVLRALTSVVKKALICTNARS